MSGPKLPVRNPCRVILTKWRSMSTLRRSVQFGCLFLCYFGMGVPELSAQGPGVTEHEIAIGSCAALEGPSSFLGRETVAGAQTYFDLDQRRGRSKRQEVTSVLVRRQLRPGESARVLGQTDGPESVCAGFLRWDPDCGEICSLGRIEGDSVGGIVHGGANSVCATAALGDQRTSFLLR
jgi:hypothetical protein